MGTGRATALWPPKSDKKELGRDRRFSENCTQETTWNDYIVRELKSILIPDFKGRKKKRSSRTTD
jgi:hypothetical protein